MINEIGLGIGIGLGGIHNEYGGYGSGNGVRPGRRYRLIDTSKRMPERTVEIVSWVAERGRWRMRTVNPDGTLGVNSLILPDGLRKRYTPIGTS